MTLLFLLCSIFDLCVLYIFIRETMGERKEFSVIIYYVAFICDELLMALCSMFTLLPTEQLQHIFNVVLSFLLIYMLTLLHEGSLKQRLYTTFSFQLCASFSEVIVFFVFSLLPQTLSELLLNNTLYGALSSKIVLLVLCSILILYSKRKDPKVTANYTILVLLMPLLSLIIMLALPIQTNASQLQNTIGFVIAGGILTANIVNYFLLQNIGKVQELYQVEENLKKQIEYQTAKYQQLSTAYRDTRRVIHDTKKHYFFIQNCIDNRNYDAIGPYLKQSIENMEKTFIQINTGNLVVDSFLSNYISIAGKQGIQFRTDLHINPNDITIRDYDLSIILGNLLDNAISACNSVELSAPRQISVDIYTTTYELIIHIENTMKAQRYSKTEMERLNHGYGTKNVEMITLSYDGNYTHYDKNDIYHAIVSIPFHE